MTFTIKILLAMKMTALILFIAIMQVSAGSYAQKITLSQKNAKLQHVFKEIWKQSGYDFVYDKVLLQKAKPVTFSVKDATLEEALTACFSGQPFTYSIDNKIIVVKQKEVSIIQKITNFFSAIDVRGQVVDEKGMALPGATVKVKGSNVATVTNEDGEFFLKGMSEDAVIMIAYLGYKPLEVKATASMGVIKMELETSKLDEVKISGGYYETTDKLKTGSIVKVTAKDIENQPVTSPLMALQGRVPGLDIVPASGTPGSAPTIRIRGLNSLRLNEGNYPLYVIDGVPISSSNIDQSFLGGSLTGAGYDPLSTINPSSIESIEVLKDGDATAIYGSRGANGVILITTKRSRNKSDRTSFDLNMYRGVGEIPKKADLLSTKDYVNMRKEAFLNDSLAMTRRNAYDLLVWDTTRYTDWQDVLLGGMSTITDLQGSISSGSENTSFTVGGGYHKETLIFPGDFGYQRGNANISLNHASVNKKFRAGVTANYGVDVSNFFAGGNMIDQALSLPPNAPELYNSNGELNWEIDNVGGLRSTWVNPMSYLNQTQYKETQNLVTNGNLSYEFFPGLSLITNIGYTNLNSSESSKQPIGSLAPDSPVKYGGAGFSDTKRKSWIIEPRASFAKKMNAHSLEVILGTTWQKSSGSSNQLTGNNYASDALLSSPKGAGYIEMLVDVFSEYKFNSLYSRLGYNYNSKYLLNLTGRRDGSSRFGPGNRFANFWSVGGAWIFTSEDLIKNVLSVINFGKLRASYGVTGSDNIGDYRYYNLYNVLQSSYQGLVGFVPSALFNDKYAWEVTKKFEVAIEAAFFEDRISAEINWYNNRSSNQLIDYKLPATTGFPSILQNFEAVVQNTGWEFMLRGEVLKSADWLWNIAGNVTIPDNKLVKFDGIEDSPYATIYKVGEPLTVQWLYSSAGVNTLTGRYEVEDLNNDGVFNNADRVLTNRMGTKIYGGINNSVRYKSVEASLFFQLAKQRQPLLLSRFKPGQTGQNVSVDVLQNWKQVGDITSIAKYSTGFGSINTGKEYLDVVNSNYNITDASFIRLKTLSIAWTLPTEWLERIKLMQSKIFIQGQNLFMLTKYKAQDPETPWGALPQLRMISAGVQIKL